MDEHAVVAMATDQDFLDVLAHPDPDPERLPDLHAASDLALQTETASRLLRAALKQEGAVERLTEAMKNDLAAWQAMIAKAQLRADGWRAIVRDWMLRTGTTQLKSPWFTASIAKGRTKKVVTDEAKAIEVCKEKYPKAVKVKESLVKAEFDVACDTFPSAFKDLYTEETSEPGLVVRKVKE